MDAGSASSKEPGARGGAGCCCASAEEASTAGAGRGMWVPGWEGSWQKPVVALAVFCGRSKETEAGPERADHLRLPRSGSALFSSHILAQTATCPGLLPARAWQRCFLVSALGCAGCGDKPRQEGRRLRAWTSARASAGGGCRGRRSIWCRF